PHVVRDQADLRKVFERKMQERQQFLDRYFVFNSDWTPPKDYGRTSGLIEKIRQSFFEIDERQRWEDESRPREDRIHEPTEALDLAGDVKGAGGAAPAPAAKPKAKP